MRSFFMLTFRIESAEAAFEALAPLAVGRSREELLDDAELDESGKLRSVDFDWIRETASLSHGTTRSWATSKFLPND